MQARAQVLTAQTGLLPSKACTCSPAEAEQQLGLANLSLVYAVLPVLNNCDQCRWFKAGTFAESGGVARTVTGRRLGYRLQTPVKVCRGPGR